MCCTLHNRHFHSYVSVHMANIMITRYLKYVRNGGRSAATSHRPNIDLMLAHRLRLWPYSNST